MRSVLGRSLAAGLFGCWACVCLLFQTSQAANADQIKFRMQRISNFKCEVVAANDINGDGRKDILAGNFWYTTPDWKPHEFRKMPSTIDSVGVGYFDDFMDAPLDVDGDGKLDVVSNTWFSTRIEWYRNPGNVDGVWTKTVVDSLSGNHEMGELVDIDGDGKYLEVLSHTRATIWYEPGTLSNGKQGLVKHLVSAELLAWGGGVGDINGDGRPDILRPDAWFEAPVDPRKGTWIKHVIAVGGFDGLNKIRATWKCPDCNDLEMNEAGQFDHTPQIWAYDVDGDKLADIVTTSAHNYGIFWYKQSKVNGVISFKQNIIDSTWTQAHNITLADVDEDGDLDFVTGKRFMAHNKLGDPGLYDPLGVYWYELVRTPTTKYIRHTITYNEGIGAGMNNVVEDMDGDGDLDIIVTGKNGGPFYFENLLRTPVAIELLKANTRPKTGVRFRLVFQDGGMRILSETETVGWEPSYLLDTQGRAR